MKTASVPNRVHPFSELGYPCDSYGTTKQTKSHMGQTTVCTILAENARKKIECRVVL